MKTFTPKFFLSLIATTLIVSGIAYAATISGVVSQTINTGDTMGQGWFQQINDKVIAVGNLAQSINTRVSTLEGAWSGGGFSIAQDETSCAAYIYGPPNSTVRVTANDASAINGLGWSNTTHTIWSDGSFMFGVMNAGAARAFVEVYSGTKKVTWATVIGTCN